MIESMWPIYTTLNNQILQTQEMKVRLSCAKVVLSLAIFIYALQVQAEELTLFFLFLLPPLVALFFDFQIKARTKAIERDSQYLRDYLEPLFQENSGKSRPGWGEPVDLNTFLFPERFRMQYSLERTDGGTGEKISHWIFTFFLWAMALVFIYSRCTV